MLASKNKVLMCILIGISADDLESSLASAMAECDAGGEWIQVKFHHDQFSGEVLWH